MPNNTLNIMVADKQLFNCVFKDGKIVLNEEFKFLPNLLDVFGGDSSILTNLRSALYVNWLFEGSLLTIQYGYYSKFLLEKKK